MAGRPGTSGGSMLPRLSLACGAPPMLPPATRVGTAPTGSQGVGLGAGDYLPPPTSTLPPSSRVESAPSPGSLSARSPGELHELERAGTAPVVPHSARLSKNRRSGPGRPNTTPGRSPSKRQLKPLPKRRKSPPRQHEAQEEVDEEAHSKELRAVREWWMPVEAAIRSKRPEQLEAALKEAHGAPYLRTVFSVRRCSSLDAAHRHSIEMEMAQRLVKARAVLGKWKSGVEEIRKAHKQRDVEALAAALGRFQLSEEHDEVTEARKDLSKWQHLAETLPVILKEGMEKKDVPKLKKAITILHQDGPTAVKGADEAQKVIERYSIRARALDNAVAEGNTALIQNALATWDFGKDDSHAVEARAALTRREQQKQLLADAVGSNDGSRLRDVVMHWDFDRNDEDFQKAELYLKQYIRTVEEIKRCMVPPSNLTALGLLLQKWEWSQADPILVEAKDCLEQHGKDARAALDSKDGWLLERLWVAGGGGKGFQHGEGGFRPMGPRWQMTVAIQRYREAINAIRSSCRKATQEAETVWFEVQEDSDDELPDDEDDPEEVVMFRAGYKSNPMADSDLLPAEQQLKGLIENWPFLSRDPDIAMAAAWLQARQSCKNCYFKLLKLAVASGNTYTTRNALRMARAVGTCPKQSQHLRTVPADILEGKELLICEDAAIQAVGAMSLGVEPERVIVVAAKSRALADKAREVREAAAHIEIGRIPTLRAAAKPHPIIHAILEMICHAVAGLNPTVRNPPRDTGWRSCQRMLSNPGLLIENLTSLPDWASAGRIEPIMRAKAIWTKVCVQAKEHGRLYDVTQDAVKKQSVLACDCLKYMQILFEYAGMVQSDAISDSVDPFEDAVGVETKRIKNLRNTLMEVHEQVQKDAPEMSDDLRRAPNWFHVFRRAWRSLGSHTLLASAWMVAGGNLDDVVACCNRSRAQMLENYAVLSVANSVLASLAKSANKASGSQEGKSKAKSNHAAAQARRIMNLDEKPKGAVQIVVKSQEHEVLTEFWLPPKAPVKEIYKEIEDREGVPAKHQRLLVNKHIITAGPIKDLPGAAEHRVVVDMLVLSNFLPQRVEAAIEALNQCQPKDFELVGKHGKPVSEPALAMLFGKGAGDLQAAEKVKVHENVKAKLQENGTEAADPGEEAPVSPQVKKMQAQLVQVPQLMLEVLKAIAEILRAHAKGIPTSGAYAAQDDRAWQMQVLCQPFELSAQLIKTPIVPQANVQLAVRMQRQLRWDDLQTARLRPASAPRERDSAGASPKGDGKALKSLTNKDSPRSPSPKKEIRSRAASIDSMETQRSGGSIEASSPKAGGSPQATRRTSTMRRPSTAIGSHAPPPPPSPPKPDVARSSKAVEAFVQVVQAYYKDFAPRRAEAAAALQAAIQAEAAYVASSQVLEFVSGLTAMYDKPKCETVEDVKQATMTACEQLVVLSQCGLSLSFPHVEFVRCAIDSAGLTMLDSPPATDAFQRLRWAEAIMAVQLSPLPILTNTLERISKLLVADELQEMAMLPEPPEAGIKGLRAAAAERLLAALAWVVDPNCSCDQRWEQSRQIVADPGFLEKLGSWDPMKDSSTPRLSRAREVLLEVWSWVATGCDGSFSFQILFAWLSLAVATLPLAELGKELKPVHRVIESGLEKVRNAKPENKVTVAAKAWTAALFLLDGKDEVWWWLGLVRGSAQANKPWTDSEEGGVGAAQEGFNVDPEDEWQQGEDPFDGANVDEDEDDPDKELLDKEMDTVDLQSEVVPYTGY
mmetsp:Transcript_84487/g.149531  ORF Transcript_84487/g.149531 Transcript_84487/m.149531 type:complete len:1742 (-) Transcript_84487:58-5283(-)